MEWSGASSENARRAGRAFDVVAQVGWISSAKSVPQPPGSYYVSATTPGGRADVSIVYRTERWHEHVVDHLRAAEARR